MWVAVLVVLVPWPEGKRHEMLVRLGALDGVLGVGTHAAQDADQCLAHISKRRAG